MYSTATNSTFPFARRRVDQHPGLLDLQLVVDQLPVDEMVPMPPIVESATHVGIFVGYPAASAAESSWNLLVALRSVSTSRRTLARNPP